MELPSSLFTYKILFWALTLSWMDGIKDTLVQIFTTMRQSFVYMNKNYTAILYGVMCPCSFNIYLIEKSSFPFVCRVTALLYNWKWNLFRSLSRKYLVAPWDRVVSTIVTIYLLSVTTGLTSLSKPVFYIVIQICCKLIFYTLNVAMGKQGPFAKNNLKKFWY